MESAWDLVPFSFIIDWFFTVGDTICAFSPLPLGVTALASWITTTESTVQTFRLTGASSQVGVCGSYLYTDTGCTFGNGEVAYKISTKKTRTPNYQRNLVPRINVNLDPLKILDLGIILRKGRSVQSYVKAGM